MKTYRFADSKVHEPDSPESIELRRKFRAAHKKYLQYIVNTGGNVTVAGFDDDWEPIGPMVRRDLMPTYIVELANGKLALTDAGRAALSEE